MNRRWIEARWRNERLFLLLVALLAIGLRLGYDLLFIGPSYAPELDAHAYSDIAISLATGHGYRLADGALTATRPPLFPLILAGIYKLRGGEDYWAGLLFQTLIGAGIVLATYAAGKRAFGATVGRIAALIAATYPLLIFSGGALLSEPLFTLWVMLAVVVTLRLLECPTWRDHLLLGASLGLAWLTRPNGLLLTPFILLWLLAAGRDRLRRRLVGIIAVAFVTLAIASPWIVRNYAVFGKLIPSYSLGGGVLFGSYNERILNEPELRGSWVSPCEVPGAAWSCELDELGRDAAWYGLGLTFIRSHLADLPRIVWWRFIDFWHLYPFAHGFPANVGFFYYVGVALLALAGLWLMRKRWRTTGLLSVVILCFMLNALAFWGGFRIRTPAEPGLIILAAAALASVFFRQQGAL
jgi:4-amino-4-deoxy-L-arabinose transferase-like glycosyltransferase